VGAPQSVYDAPIGLRFPRHLFAWTDSTCAVYLGRAARDVLRFALQHLSTMGLSPLLIFSLLV
jgi:hypothetical protein